MMENTLVSVTDLKTISLDKGDVMHGMKKTDSQFNSFGELYFSWIKQDEIKGWKKHRSMTMNLIVPVGEVCFVFRTDEGKVQRVIAGRNCHKRITVPPETWFAFRGQHEGESLVVNLADIEHDWDESERVGLDYYSFEV